jgi:hypothetical protein
MRHFTGNRTPGILEVIAKEEKLISYIVEKHIDNFSLDLFKEWYAWNCRDLISMMDNDFKFFLYVFFNDEGLNLLASMVNLAGQYESGINILEGLKSALKPFLVNKLLVNAANY